LPLPNTRPFRSVYLAAGWLATLASAIFLSSPPCGARGDWPSSRWGCRPALHFAPPLHRGGGFLRRRLPEICRANIGLLGIVLRCLIRWEMGLAARKTAKKRMSCVILCSLFFNTPISSMLQRHAYLFCVQLEHPGQFVSILGSVSFFGS
jgi:hypothetical protein